MIDYRRVGIAFSLFLALILFSWARADAQLQPATATLTHVTGQVEVLRGGQGAWVPAQTGARLAEGDQIRALGNSSAELATPDGSVILVAENTRFAVTKLEYDKATGARNDLFHLVAGKIVASVKRLAVQLVSARQSNFAISTPTGVAAVRGTVATVLFDPQTQQAMVLIQPSPGEPESLAQATYVNLRTGQTVTVGGNQFVTQIANNPPAPPQPLSTLPPGVVSQISTAVNKATAGSPQLTATTVSIVTPEQLQNVITTVGVSAPPPTPAPVFLPNVTPGGGTANEGIGRDVHLTCSSPPCP